MSDPRFWPIVGIVVAYGVIAAVWGGVTYRMGWAEDTSEDMFGFTKGGDAACMGIFWPFCLLFGVAWCMSRPFVWLARWVAGLPPRSGRSTANSQSPTSSPQVGSSDG